MSYFVFLALTLQPNKHSSSQIVNIWRMHVLFSGPSAYNVFFWCLKKAVHFLCLRCQLKHFYLSHCQRIEHVRGYFTVNVLYKLLTAYLCNLIYYHQSSHLLCFSSQSLLHVSRIKKTDFGHSAFSCTTPHI